jgi:hypothetical protein
MGQLRMRGLPGGREAIVFIPAIQAAFMEQVACISQARGSIHPSLARGFPHDTPRSLSQYVL